MTPSGWKSLPPDERNGSYYDRIYHKITKADTHGHQLWCVTRSKGQYYVDSMGTDDDDFSRAQGPFRTLREACQVAETLEGLKVDGTKLPKENECTS